MSQALINDLKRSIRGEVRFSAGDRGIYAADSSNYREVPMGAVIPLDIEDMVAAVAACARHGAAIVHRGGGTSLAGQTVSEGAVVIDSSKYCHKIISIDPEKKLAVVEPGVVLDDLRQAAGEHGLTFAPDPSTHNHNTLGGMIGNNSCGVHSIEGRRTLDNVEELEILTYDGARMTVGKTPEAELERLDREPGRMGDIYRGLKYIRDHYANEIRARFPKIPRRVSGYSIDELLPENGFHVARALVGSESTCVTVLRATLRLIPDPKKKLILVIGFDTVEDAADAVPEILPFRDHGMIALEGMDDELANYMRKKNIMVHQLDEMPQGKGWLFAQFGGETEEIAKARGAALQTRLKGRKHIVEMKLLSGKAAEDLWDMRKGGLGATCWIPGMKDTWEGWEDSAVHPDNLGAYMRDLRDLFNKYQYHGTFYGHFGDGLIHTRIDSGLHTEEEVKHFRHFVEEAAALVVRHGGTLSGEHGDGRSRAEFLPIMFGPKVMQAFEEFKRIWDPLNKMNPGKLVMPKKMDTDLRYGPVYEKNKRELETVFHYPESENSFRRATMRCVGVGECRRHKDGTLCPSYRGTMEEKHSTRGRARLLQEMFETGGPISDGWKSEAVREALDLCLSCKACKSECPVNVDMAIYRAEFFHHHYKGKLRPLAGYSMGLVHRWAPLASKFPWLMNAITQTPGISAIAKAISGVHQKRTLPKLAGKTFRAQWKDKKTSGAIRAILWVDTFNNYFTPKPLLAAAEVLERCGYEVVLPKQGLCCGRPYYDFGRLTEAKAMLAQAMEFLAPMLDARSWLVGIEASCLSVFREELVRLFPNDARARLICERTLTLGAFLKKHGHPEITLEADVAIHGHCHHKSVLGINDDIAVLKTSGRKIELLDDGCCGMAGAFGYEKEKYAVSENIAQLGVVKHLNETPRETIIAADGFSCRHQIAHFTDRSTVTLPELLLHGIRP